MRETIRQIFAPWMPVYSICLNVMVMKPRCRLNWRIPILLESSTLLRPLQMHKAANDGRDDRSQLAATT